jgi:hypothetical protein
MPVAPFPINYPPEMEETRRQTIQALGSDDPDSSRLERCRFKSRCNSCFCPLCCKGRAYRDKGRILEAANNVPTKSLRFATFKTKDVALDNLREAGQIIMQTGRTVLGRLGVSGYVCRLECSFEEWHDNVHAHAHAIIHTPSGGRGYIPASAFEDEWLSALPSSLHPVTDAVHVAPVRDLEAAATYISKSPFFQTSAARTVAALRQLRGVQRVAYRGSLANSHHAHCAAA